MQKTRATFRHHSLIFKRAAKTSRDTLKTKDTYFIELWDHMNPEVTGIGECAPIWGLSVESKDDLEQKLQEVCDSPDYFLANMSLLDPYPALRFGLEMAQLDLTNGGKKIFYPSLFTESKTAVPINGLVWMGDFDFMYQQIQDKIQAGFKCIKLKIGALDFDREWEMIASIREKFSKEEIEIRVDANGAFHPDEALEKLNRLAELNLHSIEQPIQANQWEAMRNLCLQTPLPIALDEELIGITDLEKKKEMLDFIQPQYVIFKPSLIGGFKKTKEWIELCAERNTPWWITSALEANIGLNAIAQFTYLMNPKEGAQVYSGLGTGGLFENNEGRILDVRKGEIWY